MKYSLIALPLLILNLLPLNSHAGPFTACPTEAFLVQDTNATFYSGDLLSGQFNVLESNMGTTQEINAIGFNTFDNYIYGWSKETGDVVKIGDDYQIQALTTTGFPANNGHYFVGDVSPTENYYYVYRILPSKRCLYFLSCFVRGTV